MGLKYPSLLLGSLPSEVVITGVLGLEFQIGFGTGLLE